MTNPILRTFQMTDADALINRDGEQTDAETIRWQATQGPAWTAEVDGQILGSAGIIIPWPGIGQAWMVLLPEIEHYGLWMYREVRRAFAQIVETQQLHRMEALAVEGIDRNHRWLEALGFTREVNGVARKFLPDQRAMVRYEWVQEERAWQP